VDGTIITAEIITVVGGFTAVVMVETMAVVEEATTAMVAISDGRVVY